MLAQNQTLPVIFLMGPTAAGKTALSIGLAKSLGAEIISVDSALVYRGFDIGTAKPDLAERDGIAHHLIDVCEPWEAYSAAQFCRDAIKLIESIQARGSVPLLVGGTMLYFNALQHGLSELPAADEVVRTELLEEAKLKGWSSLHEQLCRLDPVAGKRIHPNDPQRIQRALEVFRISGNTLTELQARKRSFLAKPPCKLAMVPVHRHWLHQRIDQRFEQMIELGFLDEVSELRKDSRMLQELPAVRSVGYRQAWQHLEQQASARESEPDGRDWQDKAKAATRQLAKRQLTWLRGMDDIKVVDCGEGIAQSQQLTQAQSHLQSGWTGV